ncbi:MAG TPA: autotransporter assembly complex family protein [Burkholderiaceae bacterium]|nr:autotransporter assembly complex family protein [Burkholderiaceae bacterium]
MNWVPWAAALLPMTIFSIATATPVSAEENQRAAERITYRVEIEAPGELHDMLREGLDLIRWETYEGLSAPLLDRLLEEALRTVREAVATRGYFDAKVTGTIDREKSPWRVLIRVEPGPRTQVADVDLRLRGPVTGDPNAGERLQEIRDNWHLRSGMPFTQEDWTQAKQGAVRELAASRYAAAQIGESQALINPASHTAALTVELDSGPPFYFGPVEVIGSKRYDEGLIRNISPIERGAPYERAEVLRYQRRLLQTGYFAGARVDIDPDPARAQSAPVRVAVIEGPSQNVEAGVSYDTDTGPRTDLRYHNMDLFDSAWRLRSQLRLGANVQRAAVDLDLPPREDSSWFSTFARLEQTDIQNETTTALSFGVAHNREYLGAPSGPVISMHVDEARVAGLVADRRRALFLGYRFAVDHTDDPVSPRSGYLGAATIGVAPSGFSTRRFVRATLGATFLRPLSPRDDLMLRVGGGYVVADARSGIPSTFLFRTGGDQTVRGYEYQSLGVPQGDAIVGGRYLAHGTLEYIRWIRPNWGAAVFVDAGDAWDEDRAFKLAVGAGVGARLRTPIGPVRVDLAYGEQTKDIRLHLSIGYTFWGGQ